MTAMSNLRNGQTRQLLNVNYPLKNKLLHHTTCTSHVCEQNWLSPKPHKSNSSISRRGWSIISLFGGALPECRRHASVSELSWHDNVLIALISRVLRKQEMLLLLMMTSWQSVTCFTEAVNIKAHVESCVHRFLCLAFLLLLF